MPDSTLTMTACGRKQPLKLPGIIKSECPLLGADSIGERNQAMLEIYDHALLADKKLATHVNGLLEVGTINDGQALCS